MGLKKVHSTPGGSRPMFPKELKGLQLFTFYCTANILVTHTRIFKGLFITKKLEQKYYHAFNKKLYAPGAVADRASTSLHATQ